VQFFVDLLQVFPAGQVLHSSDDPAFEPGVVRTGVGEFVAGVGFFGGGGVLVYFFVHWLSLLFLQFLKSIYRLSKSGNKPLKNADLADLHCFDF
jgi:hypothetical protein